MPHLSNAQIVDIACKFTAQPDLDLGPELGQHDLEGRLLTDFQGAFTFDEHKFFVTYDLAIHDDVYMLEIVQEVEFAGDASLIITYFNGLESVALTGAADSGSLGIAYEGKRIKQISVQLPDHTFVLVRDEEHDGAEAPIFKPVAQ
jgi:hypothetical protein